MHRTCGILVYKCAIALALICAHLRLGMDLWVAASTRLLYICNVAEAQTWSHLRWWICSVVFPSAREWSHMRFRRCDKWDACVMEYWGEASRRSEVLSANASIYAEFLVADANLSDNTIYIEGLLILHYWVLGHRKRHFWKKFWLVLCGWVIFTWISLFALNTHDPVCDDLNTFAYCKPNLR